ncbi:hypothetical protein A4X09_0g5967 [Tilletia walkeri]|uniref:Uncharacterized protein n=1 Tax=Tilletia walkeri TaxID=117179 RepID=A0A8X7T348_9BASI|nr:hypothetical protein A4X09_0g5967 [Tilletia walkeri]
MLRKGCLPPSTHSSHLHSLSSTSLFPLGAQHTSSYYGFPLAIVGLKSVTLSGSTGLLPLTSGVLHHTANPYLIPPSPRMRAFLRMAQQSPNSQAQNLPSNNNNNNNTDLASSASSDRLRTLNSRHSSTGIGYAPSLSPSPSAAVSPLDDPPDRLSLSRQNSNNTATAAADDDRRHRRRRSIGRLHSVMMNTNGLSLPGSGSSSSSHHHHHLSPRRSSGGNHPPSSYDSDWTDRTYDAEVDGAPSYYEQALKRGLLSPQQLKDGPSPHPTHLKPSSSSSSLHPPSAASAMASRELRNKRSLTRAQTPPTTIAPLPPTSYIHLGRVRSQVEEWEDVTPRLPPSSSSSSSQGRDRINQYEDVLSMGAARSISWASGTANPAPADHHPHRVQGTAPTSSHSEGERVKYASDVSGSASASAAAAAAAAASGGGSADVSYSTGTRRGSATSTRSAAGSSSFPYIPPALTSPPPKEPLPPPPPGSSNLGPRRSSSRSSRHQQDYPSTGEKPRRGSGSGGTNALGAGGGAAAPGMHNTWTTPTARRHSHHPQSPSIGSLSSGWPGGQAGGNFSFSGGGGGGPAPGPSAYSFSQHQQKTPNGASKSSNNSRFVASSSFSTQSLAAQLNELAVAFADGLLDPDEYRILRQGIFDRMSADPDMAVPEITAIKGMASSRVSIDGGPHGGMPPPLGTTFGNRNAGGESRRVEGSTVSSGAGENGHMDDSESSIYESAHSHRSGVGGGGGGGGGPAERGGGATSSMSVAATSLFSSVVAAASLFRRTGNNNNISSSSSSSNNNKNRTRDVRGASVSSGSSGPRQQAQLSPDGHGAHDMLNSSGRESSASMSGMGGYVSSTGFAAAYGGHSNSALGFSSPDVPSSSGLMNFHRARSGSNAGSLRGGVGGRTSAASSHSRPSIMGSAVFMAPGGSHNVGGIATGSESHSLMGGGTSSAMGSQRSAFGAGNGVGGSFGTGSVSGSGAGGDRKKRTGSAASSHELEHRFRAARAAAVGVGIPALDRSPSMRSRQGSGRAYGTLGGSGASIMSGGTHGAFQGGGGRGDASSVSSANHLYSDSKSMISRVSTAASASASGLFGADYAQKGSAEIQAEIKVVEEEGMRMLENFVGLERATLGKADVGSELMQRIQEARSLGISQGDDSRGTNAANTATLRRTASLGSAGGWMSTIRAASRDRKRSGTSDGSSSIFSAFTFGRGKKDKSAATADSRPGSASSMADMGHSMPTSSTQSHATAGPGSGGVVSSRSMDSAAQKADGHATIRSARRPDGSRAGSLTGRSGYPPPSASALRARGLAPPPPSAYRLNASTGPSGVMNSRGHSQQQYQSTSRSDVGHSSMAGGGGGGYGSDAELEDALHSNSQSGSTLNPLRRLLGERAVNELELDPVTANAAANLVAELDDIDTRKAAVLKRYHDRTSYLNSQLQSARIREKLMAR